MALFFYICIITIVIDMNCIPKCLCITAILLALGVVPFSCTPQQPAQNQPTDQPEDPGTDPGDDPGTDPEAPSFVITNMSGKELDMFLQERTPLDGAVMVKTNLKNEEWEVSGGADWCRVTREGTLIRLNIDAYGDAHEYLYPRSCKLLFKANGMEDRTFVVAQESDTRIGAYSYQSEFTLSPTGAPLDIFIYSNFYRWKVINHNDWFDTEQPDQVTLRVKAHPKAEGDKTTRSGKIILMSAAWNEEDIETFYYNRVSYMYFKDGAPDMSGEDYEYGDHKDWD